jgi:hypothetical protein
MLGHLVVSGQLQVKEIISFSSSLQVLGLRGLL